MREWKLGIVKYCVTKVPGCVLSQQPIPFLYFLRACSVLAPLCPSSWPPQKLVSICLASPAMTQHWLQNMYTHIYRHTLPLVVSLWGLGHLCSHGFPFLFILSVLWYEDLQMCLDSCFLYFYLDWGPNRATLKLWVKTKRLIQFCVSFLGPYPGPLTSTWCFVIVLLFC